ncbi:NUDIX domain-containing protein [Streptomyces sp. NRRL WC-3742]|uniref:NUDIX domain-containing protein n=1 Tax=Streptomyces sp. NRRL WC-3742 TaxID=1463934 RepID=UPI0022772EB3|nr:NUDIX domain-containing protein [Streptomyces sp. NRRL WC-3742]
MSVLIRDPQRRVLLVQPATRDDFVVPGGSVHPDESLEQAAARVLAYDLGMRRSTEGVLVRDRVPACFDSGAAERLHVVLDGGTMSGAQAGALSVPVGGQAVNTLAWVSLDDLSKYVRPHAEARVRAAYGAACSGLRLRAGAGRFCAA